MSTAADTAKPNSGFGSIASRQAVWAVAAALFVAAVPFAAFTALTLYHFYVKGGFFCHALPGLAVFSLLYSGFRLRTALGLAVAAIVSIAFCFNGLALAIARYPHFEMLIVGTALLFFVALARRQLALASVFFAACLA